MHTSTKLLMAVCATAIAAASAGGQTADTSTVRIRISKESPATTRTGSASGVLGTPYATSSPVANNCSGTNCPRPDSVGAAAACVNPDCAANSSMNASVSPDTTTNPCVGTACTGNANVNANACTGSNCNPAAAASSACIGANCPPVTSGNTLVPANADTMTAAGDVDLAFIAAPDLQLLQSMTDANILAHLAMGDSLEIRMAQQALAETQDSRVRDFANVLVADHTQSLQQGRTVAQQAGLTPQLAVGDTAGMRMMDHMNMNMSGNMSGNVSGHAMMTYSDAMFIRHNVMMHRHMLNELNALRSVAQNDAVKNQIVATIPVVEKHLSTARQLATDLHVDLNTTMTHGGPTPPPAR